MVNKKIIGVVGIFILVVLISSVFVSAEYCWWWNEDTTICTPCKSIPFQSPDSCCGSCAADSGCISDQFVDRTDGEQDIVVSYTDFKCCDNNGDGGPNSCGSSDYLNNDGDHDNSRTCCGDYANAFPMNNHFYSLFRPTSTSNPYSDSSCECCDRQTDGSQGNVYAATADVIDVDLDGITDECLNVFWDGWDVDGNGINPINECKECSKVGDDDDPDDVSRDCTSAFQTECEFHKCYDPLVEKVCGSNCKPNRDFIVGPFGAECCDVNGEEWDGKEVICTGATPYCEKERQLEIIYDDEYGGFGVCSQIQPNGEGEGMMFGEPYFSQTSCETLGCEFIPSAFVIGGSVVGECRGFGAFPCQEAITSGTCFSWAECVWDPAGGGGTGSCEHEVGFCNITRTSAGRIKNLCTECTTDAHCEAKYGASWWKCSKKKGANQCYNAGSELSCGSDDDPDLRECQKIVPRASGSSGSGYCVENYGICHKTGPNTVCYDPGIVPSNLEVVGPNDFYRNILGKVGPQIKAVLETRCSLAEMTSVSQNDTNFPLAIPFVPSYSDTFFSSLKGRCTYSRPNANTYVATFRWGDGKLKGYIMGYTAIRKQYTTHNIITGYVKQVTGGASGRGRGRGKPKPIYLPVFGTFSSRSITHFFGLGPGFSYEVKKDWTVGVNLLVSSITDDVGFAVITAYESQGSGLFDLALTAGSFPGNLGGFAILKMIFNF